MKVAIRVDASVAIGTGHVRRMVSLADALARKGAEVRFIWRDHGLDVKAMLPNPLWSVQPLRAPLYHDTPPEGRAHGEWGRVASELDAAETIARIKDFGPDWIVIDHYAYGLQWHAAIRTGTAARLAVIDDLADSSVAADIIVDQNYHPAPATKFAGLNVADAILLAGPAYAMLADSYADATRYQFSETVRSIGIFMGGVDAPGTSLIALQAIDLANLDCHVEIASTDANPNLAALRRAAAARPKTTLTTNLPHLAGFFAHHDLQIGAGGGALWERLCIGAPTIAVICAENQRESVPYLADIGAVRMADGLQAPADATNAIASQLLALAEAPDAREAMMKLGKTMVDGCGSTRIADALGQFNQGNSR